MAELSILICTLNDRIASVPCILLPVCEEVVYVVSFQYTDSMFLDMVPEELASRPDVMLLPSPGVGLSANRNNAMRHCQTPYAVIADDDSVYSLALLKEIILTFQQRPQLDILTFADGRLAFRLTPDIPQFDTRFGLGSAYLSCGEEEVLLCQARKLGLSVAELPSAPCVTGSARWNLLAEDQRARRSWGALQYMTHSTTVAFLRIVGKSLTLPLTAPHTAATTEDARMRTSRWRVFKDMIDGLRYIIRHPLNDSVAEEIPLDFQPIDIWKMP